MPAAAVDGDALVVDDERYDVQLASRDVLLHVVKVTCEGLIASIDNCPHSFPSDADDIEMKVRTRLLEVVEAIEEA